MSASVSPLGRLVSVLLGALVLVAVGAGIAGMTLDNHFQASASVIIAAPRQAVHAFVASPRQHATWIGWDDGVDPSLQRTYEGPDAGVGAASRFEGELVGAGSLRVDAEDPDRGVEWTQALPNGVRSRGSVRYEALAPDRTRVTWREEGTIPRPHGPFFAGLVSRSLTRHQERALLFLSAAAEGRPPPNRNPRSP
ncbi:MAG: SRPBCC family protein [Polyangiales bacterium]|nr:SRPBCC family protein [Myxococcales bacterium]MCB9661301.1 SRPBCC family protein [Sandaracinaceae bacterium]